MGPLKFKADFRASCEHHCNRALAQKRRNRLQRLLFDIDFPVFLF